MTSRATFAVEGFGPLSARLAMASLAANAAEDAAPAAARSDARALPLEAGDARFLEPAEAAGETVVLASYPRSGNSLLRKLLEETTGVITGSDTAPNRTLSRALAECGVRGEGVVDSRCWIVKSHYPERRGHARVAADRAVLLVRNPWDAIDSYFNMALTNSHNTSVSDADYERFSDLFRGLAVAETRVWCRFNRWWLAAPVPLLVVRYEDLVAHRPTTLDRIAGFLGSASPRVDAARLADRARAAAASEDAGFYAPRRGGARVLGAARGRFDAALLAEMESIAGPMLKEFGYSADRGFPERVSVAPRALRSPVPAGDGRHTAEDGRLLLNAGAEVRDKDSPYGRYMTTLRRSLTDPVVSDAGVELNMHEVEAARGAATAATNVHEKIPPANSARRKRKP